MLIARRLYVYFISAVSLAMTAFGLASLMSLALSRIWEAAGGSVIQESSHEIRQELSLYSAMVIVALPVWLLHWWLAERAVHRPAPDGENERTSSIRALYLTLTFAVPLIFFTIASVDVVSRILRRLMDGSSFGGGTNEATMSISLMLVATLVMAYHGSIRLRDIRGGMLEDSAAWLPRLYLYVASFTGAILLLFGVADLIRVIDDVLFGARSLFVVDRWWAGPLSGAIARVLVGLVIWGVHWGWSLRALRREDWVGGSERRSSLRWFYVYTIVFVSIIVTLNGAASGLNATFDWLLSVPRDNPNIGWARTILEPLVVAVPFAAFWAYHRLIVRHAAQTPDEAPLADSLRRLYTYLVSVVGLAVAAVGTAYILGTLIDLLLGGSRTIGVSSIGWRDDVARFSSLALVGAGAWLWSWNVAERHLHDDEEAERGATTRRVYLYLTLASTLVAMLVSLAIILYRAISQVLGVTTGSGLVSTISTALGILIVAGALFAYHIVVLRQDLMHREECVGAPEPERVMLILTVPTGGDAETTLREMRAHLPEGFQLTNAGLLKRETTSVAPPLPLEGDHA